jgi:hypothetical protein
MVNQLPAYLQNRQSRTVTERAASGLGGSMPAHISIQGNSFTLIDAAGNESNEGGTIDVCIADVSDVNCKRYYGYKPWTPDSNDAPLCWSANGVGPSRDASSPQNAICATCPHNERGSAISKISNKAIKACRDEKWLAIILPKYPTMLFQLVLTPGSFKNWKEFLKPFETHGVDISDTVTRLSFEPKVTGVLLFTPAQTPQGGVIWIDENTAKAREAALTGKATDLLVGRNDIPIQGQLAAPKQEAIAAPAEQPAFGQGTQGQAQAPAGRKRRATAEAAPPAQPSNFGNNGPAQAPFMPPEQPNGGAAFGMAAGAEPNQALASTLENLFGKK